MWRVSAFDSEGREIASLELSQGEIAIGRETGNQIVLPSASVSRRHARILCSDGALSIVDEGSANGVLVDGARISDRAAIAQATRIDVAEFRISIEPMAGEARIPPPEPAPAEFGSDMRLVATGGPYDGRMFGLPLGTLTVGRSADNDVVLDDPSLSRKHARLVRSGDRIELEDLGSSNGTWVSGRRVGRGTAGPGDVIRFGDLSFRLVGGEHESTRSVDPVPRLHLVALIGGGSATLIILILAVVFLVRKVPPVRASGREAIARIVKQADLHLQAGQKLYQEKKYADAKPELDQAVELDPGNAEARRLRTLAAHGGEDDRAYASANASIAIGDLNALESAVRLYGEMTLGSPAKTQLQSKLAQALARFGNDRCSRRAYSDCAWALCRAFEVAPEGGRPSSVIARLLRDAERKAKRSPCRAAD